eukprot:1178748-Prorocentrum_minimum.AAC.1
MGGVLLPVNPTDAQQGRRVEVEEHVTRHPPAAALEWWSRMIWTLHPGVVAQCSGESGGVKVPVQQPLAALMQLGLKLVISPLLRGLPDCPRRTVPGGCCTGTFVPRRTTLIGTVAASRIGASALVSSAGCSPGGGFTHIMIGICGTINNN